MKNSSIFLKYNKFTETKGNSNITNNTNSSISDDNENSWYQHINQAVNSVNIGAVADTKSNFNFVKPEIKYFNADIHKARIFADNRNKIGVYRWINNLNGKTYIGSSVNLSVRFYKYYSLRSLAKSNRPMERALLKYGFSNFSLEIIEFCNLENLLKREQFYLDLCKPEYNIVEKAGSTIGYKHSE